MRSPHTGGPLDLPDRFDVPDDVDELAVVQLPKEQMEHLLEEYKAERISPKQFIRIAKSLDKAKKVGVN